MEAQIKNEKDRLVLQVQELKYREINCQTCFSVGSIKNGEIISCSAYLVFLNFFLIFFFFLKKHLHLIWRLFVILLRDFQNDNFPEFENRYKNLIVFLFFVLVHIFEVGSLCLAFIYLWPSSISNLTCRTRSAFRCAARSWSTSCFPKSESWSSSSRNRNGYVEAHCALHINLRHA